MKEIFLLKLGEIVLKGANKRQFESRLRQNVRRRMKKYGNFDVYLMQSTVYVEPMDDDCDVDGAKVGKKSEFFVPDAHIVVTFPYLCRPNVYI